MGAVGGEVKLIETSLEPFPLPTVKAGEDLSEDVGIEAETECTKKQSFSGDSVVEFNEIAAARGCLGRFPGGEMMGIIKSYLKVYK